MAGRNGDPNREGNLQRHQPGSLKLIPMETILPIEDNYHHPAANGVSFVLHDLDSFEVRVPRPAMESLTMTV